MRPRIDRRDFKQEAHARKDVKAVTLSREVLDWAAERAGHTVHSFAESVAKRTKDRQRIAEGCLSISQAEKLAKSAHIPFGYLFLSTPPKIERPKIPDLRQIQEAAPLSNDFYETLEDIIAKQQWLVEYLTEAGTAELPFVGRFSNGAKHTASSVVEDMRRELGISDEDRRRTRTPCRM